MLNRSIAELCVAAAAGWLSVGVAPLRADEPAAASARADASAESKSETSGAKTEKKSAYRVQGKIVIVGPDGKRQEINIDKSSDEPIGDVVIPAPVPARILIARPAGAPLGEPVRVAVKRYLGKAVEAKGQNMIGVHGEAADPALRAQLKLGDVGVVVKGVMDDSPATKAGLAEHDLLLKAGETDLKQVQDLLDAVQAAGDKPLTLSFLRAGEKLSIDVTPVKREPKDVPAFIDKPEFHDVKRFLKDHDVDLEVFQGAPPEFRIEAIRPGIVLSDPLAARGAPPKDLAQKLEALTQQIEALRKQVEELKQK